MMNRLVRNRITRAALLFLAGHGLFRHSIEEAIKRSFLSEQDAANVILMTPRGSAAEPTEPEVSIRSVSR